MSPLRIASPVVLALTGCSRTPPEPLAEAPVTLRVVALNDFHGALYERPSSSSVPLATGGLPWLVAAVDHLREGEPELLVLDAGDQFQGSWPVNQTRGLGAVQAMNLLGVDAAAIGNHEFDYGGEGAEPGRGALLAAAGEARYPWLSANIRRHGARWQPIDAIAPFAVLERKGLRIGVVGLTTTDTPTTTDPDNVADLAFVDPVQAVRDALPELARFEPDVTLLVGHLSGSCEPEGPFEPGPPCVPDGEIGRLLEELPEGTFDAMVLGHAHTLLAHREGRTFLLEQRARGAALGLLDLVVTRDGVDVDASRQAVWPLSHEPADPGCSGEAFPREERIVGGIPLRPSEAALALVDALEQQTGTLCEPVACADAAVTRSYDGESPLGNWTADALLAAFDADLAIQNAGGLRADLPAGEIRLEHVQAMMPFDNRTHVVEMTGEQVRRLLRIGSSGQHGQLQVAGARFSFDPSRERGSDLDGDGAVAQWERDRLCDDVTIGGAPLDGERTYRVVTSDFLLSGGDHLGPAFEGAAVVQEGPLLRDVYAEAAAGAAACLDARPLLDPARPRIRQGACRE